MSRGSRPWLLTYATPWLTRSPCDAVVNNHPLSRASTSPRHRKAIAKTERRLPLVRSSSHGGSLSLVNPSQGLYGSSTHLRALVIERHFECWDRRFGDSIVVK